VRHVSFLLHFKSPHTSGDGKMVSLTIPVSERQLWFSSGLFISVPQSLASSQIREATPDVQLPHPEHDQFSWHGNGSLLEAAFGEGPAWAGAAADDAAMHTSARPKTATVTAACPGEKFILF
jgi:hypothetical protein